MFNAGNCFHIPFKRKACCSRLTVDWKLMSDETELLYAWDSHFRKLFESKVSLVSRTNLLLYPSSEECILEKPFTLDELAGAMTKLKVKKACQPDDLTAERLGDNSLLACPFFKGHGNMRRTPSLLTSTEVAYNPS